MANKKNWLGMLIVVLIFGMALVSCSNSVNLNGVWRNSPESRYEFTDGEYTLIQGRNGVDTMQILGTYKVFGSKITFTPTQYLSFMNGEWKDITTDNTLSPTDIQIVKSQLRPNEAQLDKLDEGSPWEASYFVDARDTRNGKKYIKQMDGTPSP